MPCRRGADFRRRFASFLVALAYAWATPLTKGRSLVRARRADLPIDPSACRDRRRRPCKADSGATAYVSATERGTGESDLRLESETTRARDFPSRHRALGQRSFR